MINVTETHAASCDIWSYVDSIESSDLGDLTPHDVSFVYQHPNGRWEHVLINTCTENVPLVIIVDRETKSIVGHHLLNLRKKYGLTEN